VFWNSFRYFILPAFSLAFVLIAINARLVRSSMIEVLQQDYVTFARAKGLPLRVVYLRHALRNALLPVLTVVGLQLGSLLSGTIVIETVFAWPGIGRLAVQAVHWRDYPLIQAVVLISAMLFVFLNLVVDVLYRVVDPRAKHG
jgi:peptide/nickel transport system permease protein